MSRFQSAAFYTSCKHVQTLLLTAVTCLGLFFSTASYAKQTDDPTTKLDNLTQRLVTALSQSDYSSAHALFNMNALADKTADKTGMEGKQKKELVRGLLSSLNQTAWMQQSLAAEPNMVYRQLSTIQVHNGERGVLRMDYDSGAHNFIELIAEKNTAGTLQITDVFIASSGQLISDTMADSINLMMGSNKSFFAKVLDNYQGKEDALKIVSTFLDLRRNGQYAEAYAAWKAMPEDLRNSEVMVNSALQISQNLNEQAYDDTLRLFASLYANKPKYQFMLIDYYVLQEQYEHGLTAIDSLERRYGEDAALSNLRANLYYGLKQYPQANAAAEHALTLEPDFTDGYFTLIGISIAREDYKETVALYKRFENDFGISFSAADFDLTDPELNGFYNSTAFKDWMHPNS